MQCAFEWTPGWPDFPDSNEVRFEATDDEDQTAQTGVVIKVTESCNEVSDTPVGPIETTCGQLELHGQVPDSLAGAHETTDNSGQAKIHMFNEPASLVRGVPQRGAGDRDSSALRMDARAPNLYNSPAALPAQGPQWPVNLRVPADSVLLHFDPAKDDKAVGSVTFTRDIVGISIGGLTLQDSSKVLGFQGTDYPARGDGNRLERGPGKDEVIIRKLGPRSIRVRLLAEGSDLDQVRVVLRSQKGHWQAEALQRAGIFAQRDACRRADFWAPKAGFADNRQIVKKAYSYYQAAFQEDNRLVWAALARLAGHPVWSELESLDAWEFPAKDKMLQIQKGIFCDVAWQHEALLQGDKQGDPLAYLRPALENDPTFNPDHPLFQQGQQLVDRERMLQAFASMKRGTTSGLKSAMITLVEREQGWAVAHPYWRRIENMLILPSYRRRINSAPSPAAGRSFDEWREQQPGEQNLWWLHPRINFATDEAVGHSSTTCTSQRAPLTHAS